MAEVEKLVSARKTVDGAIEYERTGKMIAAFCTHFSSRAGDPQIHTHALVANATQRADGQWRALSTDMSRQHGFWESLRDWGTFFGAIYQAEMAYFCDKEGFVLESAGKHGLFRFKHFPEAIRDHFSKRRKQIVEIAAEKGISLDNKKALDAITQKSKASKQPFKSLEFERESAVEMAAALKESGLAPGFDQLIEGSKAKSPSKREKSAEPAEAFLASAVEKLSVFQLEMAPNQLFQAAFAEGADSIAGLRSALADRIKAGELFFTAGGRISTRAQQEKAQKLTYAAQKALGPKSPASLAEALESGRICIAKEPFSLEKREKALENLVETLEGQGKKVRLLASSTSEASTYNFEARAKKTSLWDRLAAIGKDDLAQGLHGFLLGVADKPSKEKNAVWIVDGSRKLGQNQLQNLLDLSEKTKSSVVFLSFSEGRGPALAGNALEIIERAGTPSFSLAQIEQKQDYPRAKLVEVRQNLEETLAESAQRRRAQMAQAIIAKHGENLAELSVLADSKKSAAALSQEIREARKSCGALGKTAFLIEVEREVFLSKAEKKQVRSFLPGMVSKTYVGHGQFSEKMIEKVEGPLIRTRGPLGLKHYFTPQTFLPEGAKLYRRERLELCAGERIRLRRDTPQSRKMGLTSATDYTAVLDRRKVQLIPDDLRQKTLKTGLVSLAGLDLEHAYATALEGAGMRKNRPSVFLDSPSYRLSKNTVAELGRSPNSLEIYCENAEKAEKKLGQKALEPTAFDLEKIVEADGEIRTPAELAVDLGLAIIASREAAFCRKKLEKIALSGAPDKIQKIPLQAIQKAIDQKLEAGTLAQHKNSFGDIFLATPAAVQIEKSIIAQIRAGKNTAAPFMPKAAVGQTLAKTSLTAGQKSAFSLVAETTDRFSMIQGYAGTGKSTLLATLRKELPPDIRITALAPTHKAVSELEKLGIAAQTLKSFLFEQKSEGLSANPSERRLILLDESSMVANSDFLELQTIVEKSRTARCIYLGDIAQLNPVEAGKPAELAYIAAESGIATAVMGEILRQKNPALREAASLLAKGTEESFGQAFDSLERAGSIKTAANQADSIKKIAEAYVGLSKAERAQTAIGVATNSLREKINQEIRGQILSQSVPVPQMIASKLEASGLTDVELRQAKNWLPGDVLQLGGKYWRVQKIFGEQENALEVLSEDGKETKTIALDFAQKSSIAQFLPKELQVAVGDILKWTKSDKERGLVAHEKMEVLELMGPETKKIVVKPQKGEAQTLHLGLGKNQHIDHGFASTIHGLQGSTEKNMLMLLSEENKQSNTRRLLYVGATRATENLQLYTDNKQAVERQICQNPGRKTSALEHMGLLGPKEPAQPGKPASRKTNPILERAAPSISAAEVEEGLRERAEDIALRVLGKPNKALSNRQGLRYGKKGSLSISISGPKKGCFFDFESGEKGGMLSLLQRELGLNFKSALEEGNRMLGGVFAKEAPRKGETAPALTQAETTKDPQKTAYIQSLIQKSIPIEGTAGERYLAARNIENIGNTGLRFLEKISTGGGNRAIRPFAAAVVAIARDGKGNLQAIQLTYLDPKTGEKIPGLPVGKRSFGSLHEAGAKILSCENPQTAFLAEGLETALSIADAASQAGPPRSEVFAALGKSNLAKLARAQETKNIVLVLDQDGQNWEEDKVIVEAVDGLRKAGKKVVCMQPDKLGNQKIDFNDLAKSGNQKAVLEALLGAEKELQKPKGLSKKEPELERDMLY